MGSGAAGATRTRKPGRTGTWKGSETIMDRDPDSRNRVCLLNRQTRRGKAERERCRREVREKGVIDVGCSGLRRDCESLHNWGYRYTIGGYTLRSLNIDGKRLRR